MTSEFNEKLRRALSVAGLEKYSAYAEGLFTIADRLEEYGKKFNLTAITDEDGVIVKHITDCLFLADYIEKLKAESVIDVGCGGGFPSLPVGLCLPDIFVCAVDSTEKKINYVRDTANACKIKHFEAISCRAEEMSHEKARESFDVATARAVASLPVLCELCIPFVKVGGYFIAMKGARAPEEVKESESAAKKLGCDAAKLVPYSLPNLADKRFLVIYRKVSPTPSEYPRNFSRISKKSL